METGATLGVDSTTSSIASGVIGALVITVFSSSGLSGVLSSTDAATSTDTGSEATGSGTGACACGAGVRSNDSGSV